MTGGNYEFLGIPKIRFRGGKIAEIEKEIRAVNEEEQGYKTRDTRRHNPCENMVGKGME